MSDFNEDENELDEGVGNADELGFDADRYKNDLIANMPVEGEDEPVTSGKHAAPAEEKSNEEVMDAVFADLAAEDEANASEAEDEIFVDEHGNEISAAELAAGGYEVVEEMVDDGELPESFIGEEEELDEEPPVAEAMPLAVDNDEEEGVEYEYVYEDGSQAVGLAAPTEQPQGLKISRGGKIGLAGAGVVVLGLVGVVAFGLSSIGDQNTAENAKAAVHSKSAQASSAVQSKKQEVTNEAIDTCSPAGLAGAMAEGSEDPALRLNVINSVPLPGPFINARTNADGKAGTPSMLQISKTSWGLYTTTPLTKAEKKNDVENPGFWKADALVQGDSVKITGDQVWPGGDNAGAGACEPGKEGSYAATGKVPADAAGLVDGSATVDAIVGIAGEPTRAVAMMGNSLALVGLEETPPRRRVRHRRRTRRRSRRERSTRTSDFDYTPSHETKDVTP